MVAGGARRVGGARRDSGGDGGRRVFGAEGTKRYCEGDRQKRLEHDFFFLSVKL